MYDVGFTNVMFENLSFGIVAIHDGFKIWISTDQQGAGKLYWLLLLVTNHGAEEWYHSQQKLFEYNEKWIDACIHALCLKSFDVDRFDCK